MNGEFKMTFIAILDLIIALAFIGAASRMKVGSIKDTPTTEFHIILAIITGVMIGISGWYILFGDCK